MAETQTVTGVPPKPDTNGRFEDECIDLLCRQEKTLSLLGEARRKRRALDSLDLAKKMLLQFLAFAESHFDAVQLACVGQRLYNVNQRTQAYEKMLVAKSFKILRRMVGMIVPSEEELRQAHEQLCSEYMDLYKEFFSDCSKRFPEGSSVRKLFLDSVATFLNEFEERW